MTKRLTPAEADALVAHLTPEERRRTIDTFIEAMAIRGVEVRELFDAAGRSYLAVDMDAARRASLDLADLFKEAAALSPHPQGHQPPTA
jgi:hypothetical protein